VQGERNAKENSFSFHCRTAAYLRIFAAKVVQIEDNTKQARLFLLLSAAYLRHILMAKVAIKFLSAKRNTHFCSPNLPWRSAATAERESGRATPVKHI